MRKPARHLIIDSDSHISATAETWAKSRPGATDPDYRVRDILDPEGFDRSLLMPESAWWPAGIVDTQLGYAMSEAHNNYLHDFARRQPTRLYGIGVLNAADPAHAVKEMRRCVKELGFHAVYFDNEVYGMVYAGMELLDNLVTGGVCETFPQTRFGIFECGAGWVPTILDRYHERREKFGEMMRANAPKMKLGAEEYIQRQVWFGFEPEDRFVPDFIKWTRAPNRLLFSADYPHLDFEPGQLQAFLERDDVSAEHRRITVREAPLEFYRWEDTARPRVVEEAEAAA